MSLPITILPNDEKWDCHQCGICCRGSLVPLSDSDLERLKSQRWEDRPEYRGVPVFVRYQRKGSYRLAQRSDGSCVFLNERGLCRIHSELGYEAKPTICRVFPLQLVPQDKKVVLTIRRACPSSALDRGQALASHLPSVKEFVQAGRLKADPISPPLIKNGETREWKEARTVLASVAHLMQDDRYPPVRRLVHCLQFCSLLQQAKTTAFDDRKFNELVQTLAEVVPEESKPFFEERRKPAWSSRILFRQIAIEYARLHPRYSVVPSWKQRVSQGLIAWSVAMGTGRLPPIIPNFPACNYQDLEFPLGAMEVDIDRTLTRLLETSSASFLYALADRRGWTLIESIRALALTFPVGLWLLRWSSRGRTPTESEMVDIIVALDRGQGFHALTGSLHRWRLRTLSRNDELERLVVWYAR